MNCRVCGESDRSEFRIFYDGFIKLYRCRTCDYVGQYEGPGEGQIKGDYSAAYDSHLLTVEGVRHPAHRRNFQDILTRIHGVAARGDLLDVGCGDGHFLSVARESEFDCHGIEPSRTLAAKTAARLGLPVTCDHYTRASYPPNSFDVITMIQVLEHFPHPSEGVSAAYHHLRPGGVLVVEVPSVRAPHFLLYRFTGYARHLGPDNGLARVHVSYFSPETLQALVGNCGFARTRVVTGRWRHRYSGLGKRALAAVLDPIANALRVGGILLMADKPPYGDEF